MRVVIAVVVSLILAGNAWAEVTITGEVFSYVEDVPDATFPAAGYPVIVYPAGKEVAVDPEGRYTIVTDEPQRLLVIVTPFNRTFMEKVDRMLLEEDPPGTFQLERVVFEQGKKDPRLHHRLHEPRLLTYPDTTLGAFAPPCHIAVGATKFEMVFQILIGTAGEVSAAKVMYAGGRELNVPSDLVELARQELFKLEFMPAIGRNRLPVEAPFAFPARLEYDEEVGWKFKEPAPKTSQPPEELPDNVKVFYD